MSEDKKLQESIEEKGRIQTTENSTTPSGTDTHEPAPMADQKEGEETEAPATSPVEEGEQVPTAEDETLSEAADSTEGVKDEDLSNKTETPKPPTVEEGEQVPTAEDQTLSEAADSTEGVKDEDLTNKTDAPTPPTAEKGEQVPTSGEITPSEAASGPKDEEDEDVLNEIDENNAEDAEDADNQHRHNIPMLDYHSMSMENLVGELQRLVRNEKVQAIKKHVDNIKSEFDLKFQDFIEQKKEDFIANGGNEIDFRYNSVTKRQFNEVYADYREKRNQYYKNLEKDLKNNLKKRQEIIEELKGLVNVEEDMNTTYKTFKSLQEEWRNAGPVPRTHYNDVWRTYQHHVEIFYDFLHLNRELRDLDFKHNLAEKEKLVKQAEALADEPDLNKVFRELQILHKIWKEDIGPVGQEHRNEIWERFSRATKVLHQRRQDYYKQLDAQYEKNWEKKQQIIAEIAYLADNVANNHKGLQQQIKKVEELRNAFFGAGKVPRNKNEKTWAEFKQAVRTFNRNKNAYYKNLKKEQQENLNKKRELLELALALKDSEDYDSTTPEMKRIQAEWKKIGHVPRKYSDKIWKEFKGACNHYFDRLHALKNKGQHEEEENYKKKEACLERLKALELSDDRDADLQKIKEFIGEWKTYGRVPFRKKNIDQKFNKILDALFKKLDVSRQDAELLKYGNKVQELAEAENERAIQNERSFIRKKMEECKGEIRQLENNLQFFSNASEDNPLVKDVIDRVNKHKESLATWKAKLKKLNILENSLHREAEATENEEGDNIEEATE